MARFFIRRNHPYAGVLTLCKVPGGSFVAKEMVVSETEFIAEAARYLKGLSTAEKRRLRRAAPVETAPPPPPGNGDRQFKVNRIDTAVAATG